MTTPQETKKTWELNAMWYRRLWWMLEQKKSINGKTKGIQIKSWVLVNNVPMLFSSIWQMYYGDVEW